MSNENEREKTAEAMGQLCIYCQKPFLPTRGPDEMYCSEACRESALKGRD